MLTLINLNKSISLRSLSLLFLCMYSALAFSLGLGDIELRSHLNEPLNARVSLSDTDGSLDTGCFTAVDTSDVPAFKKAYINLKKSNGVSQLYITTYDVISEPIVNLLLTYHCDPQLRREFVLLLDPAPIVTPEIAANSEKPATDNIAADKPAASKPKRKTPKADTKNNAVAQNTDSATEAPIEKPKKKRKKTAAASVDEKLAEAYTGKAASATTTPAANTAKADTPPLNIATDKPRLVVSGGNNASGQPNLSLRMETQLDLARTEASPVANNTDAADEVTVMTNRLSHLEKQLLSLQAKNTQLQAENDKIKNEGMHLSPDTMEWLHRLLIGLGIIAILAIAELLRRKIMLNRLQQDEAVWFDAGPADESDELPDAKTASNAIFNEPSFSDSGFGAPKPNEFASQANLIQSENDEVENVLDHADVFIEHGRTALAIQLLQNHLEEAPGESPAIWLKLLSLLAKEGAEAEYDSAVKECNHFFNIKMPAFADALKKDNSTIEEHPHIITRLEGVWGSQYAVGFLNDLIYNQQSQPREGFERGTFEELFFLKQIATILQGNSGGKADAYKPEVVKPNLENAEMNRAVFASAAAGAGVAAAATLAAVEDTGHHVSDDSGFDMATSAVDDLEISDSQTAYTEPADDDPTDTATNDDNFLSETYEPEPESLSAEPFTDNGLSAVEIEDTGNSGFSIDYDSAPEAKPYEVDMDLGLNEPESNQSNTLEFEEIDFDLSADTAASEPAQPESSASTSVTDFEVEESDADIISKYLSQAEEKAKKKAEADKDSNVIEFDWDLPKLDKE